MFPGITSPKRDKDLKKCSNSVLFFETVTIFELLQRELQTERISGSENKVLESLRGSLISKS